MFILTKRQIYLISVLINSLVGLVIAYYDFNFYYILAIILADILVCLYLISKAHKGYYLLDKLIYISLYIFFSNLLIFNYPNLNLPIKFIMIFGLSSILYSLLISFNVYLVSEKLNEVIPLIQPARLVVIISTVVLTFISANVIYKVPIFSNLPALNLSIKVLLFAVYNYLIYFTIRWFFLESKIGDNRKKNIDKVDAVAGMAILFNTQLALLLTFYPFEAFASAVILMTGCYISINLIQNIFNHKVEVKNIVEYVVLFVLATISAFFIS